MLFHYFTRTLSVGCGSAGLVLYFLSMKNYLFKQKMFLNVYVNPRIIIILCKQSVYTFITYLTFIILFGKFIRRRLKNETANQI